jgi:hypothetical protein
VQVDAPFYLMAKEYFDSCVVLLKFFFCSVLLWLLFLSALLVGALAVALPVALLLWLLFLLHYL